MRQSMLMMSMITVEYVTNYGDKFWTRISLNVEKFIIISQTNIENNMQSLIQTENNVKIKQKFIWI